MALVSPGVSVSITDESFFVPTSAVTVPLIFVATEDEKLQPDGLTDAPGTFEWDVVRTVTSRKQALDLYGIPRFLADTAGNQFHGDARNEYGLFALNQFLGVGNRAFVVRANVNLNDDLTAIRALWNKKIAAAGLLVESLAQDFINEFNITNGYIPGDATAGYQEIDYGNSIVGTNLVGLSANTYDFSINIDGGGFNSTTVTLSGSETFDQLITAINGAITGATASIVNGQLRFTSGSSGTSSTIGLTNGTTLDLFAAIVSYVGLLTPVNGVDLFKVTVTGPELISIVTEATNTTLFSSNQQSFGSVFGSFSFSTLEPIFFSDLTATPLNVFANGFDLPATGTFIGFNGQVADWVTNLLGTLIADEFTPIEGSNLFIAVADDFQYTKEFRNGTSLGANDAARRVAITTALQATINSNTEVRSENFEFNLILCPGYHEVVDEMIALSVDILEEALVIGDTPMNMNNSDVVAWAGTTARQISPHVAYYYPHQLASNLDGVNILAAASGTALRTYTFNDNVSQLWFAPAGTRRGLISGITDVGYVSGTLGGPTTFEPLHVNLGQRDDLYKYFTNINPMVFFPGRGFLVWGQKTSNPDASALDRVNVSRMIKYIKRQLRKNTLSFVFEPNDQLTRDHLKTVVDAFLGDLIIKRGLFDAVSVSDESNNTPDRIDRNELYIDIALKPTKSAEFILIPIRIVNTGTDI